MAWKRESNGSRFGYPVSGTPVGPGMHVQLLAEFALLPSMNWPMYGYMHSKR